MTYALWQTSIEGSCFGSQILTFKVYTEVEEELMPTEVEEELMLTDRKKKISRP